MFNTEETFQVSFEGKSKPKRVGILVISIILLVLGVIFTGLTFWILYLGFINLILVLTGISGIVVYYRGSKASIVIYEVFAGVSTALYLAAAIFFTCCIYEYSNPCVMVNEDDCFMSDLGVLYGVIGGIDFGLALLCLLAFCRAEAYRILITPILNEID
jgi:hypothetical protein